MYLGTFFISLIHSESLSGIPQPVKSGGPGLGALHGIYAFVSL